MNINFAIILCLTGTISSFGQNSFKTDSCKNLVLNYGFETTTMDSIIWDSGFLKFEDWHKSPKWSNVDCYTANDSVRIHDICNSIVKIPNADSGSNFIGFVPLSWFEYFETLVGQLSEPLLAGKEYEIKFAIRHAGDSTFFRLRNLEAVFSDSLNIISVKYPFYSSWFVNNNVKIKPDVRFTLEQVSDEKWYNVNGTYIADGGERYIYFGIFHDKKIINSLGEYSRLLNQKKSKTKIKFSNPIYMSKEKFFRKNNDFLFIGGSAKKVKIPSSSCSYYFIDNVTVKEL